jgi:membrane protein
MTEARAERRGRHAARPRDIPAPGWRDILFRVKDELTRDNLSIVAAGVAFYGLLAIFPALAALVSIYGLIVEPQAAQQQIAQLEGVLPPDARSIVDQQLSQVTSSAQGALSLGVLGGLLLTLWSAGKGTKALIEALNIVNDEQEERGFLKLNAIALGLTLGILLFVVVALALVALLPALVGNLGLPETVQAWARWLRWPILAGAFMAALAVLYRYGPSRAEPRWRWVSWGAAAATLLWIVGSLLFSWYVTNFGSYNETYGSVGAVVILMMWFWLSAYIVLLGAELNAEMEHQTEQDSTSGTAQPLGRRGAYVADHVGEMP